MNVLDIPKEPITFNEINVKITYDNDPIEGLGLYPLTLVVSDVMKTKMTIYFDAFEKTVSYVPEPSRKYGFEDDIELLSNLCSKEDFVENIIRSLKSNIREC